MMKLIIILIAIFSLNSCAIYKGSFDCKAHKGIGCESVSRVNELINDDALDAYLLDGDGQIEESSRNTSNKCKSNSAKLKQCDRKQHNKTMYESEKLTIYFNEYKDMNILHKESEIEIEVK